MRAPTPRGTSRAPGPAPRQIRLPNHERDVAARRRLRHQPQRHVADRGQHSSSQRRVTLQAVANRADDRHVVVARDLGKLLKRGHDRRQPSRVVDRHRHAHLGGRHDVHRRLESLEHLEEPAEKAVRHQHPRGGDVHHRHSALRGHRGERAFARRSLASDQRSERMCPVRVENPHRNVSRDGRLDRRRVQHLGAEIRQLRRLGKRQVRHDLRVGDDARIGRQHAVHVGPDLNLARAEAGADDRGRKIGAASAQRGGDAARRSADEAADRPECARRPAPGPRASSTPPSSPETAAPPTCVRRR